MPLLGLLVGHGSAPSLGHATRYVGGGLLTAAGLWSLIQARRTDSIDRADGGASQQMAQSAGALLLTGFALSLDNLVVGFGLGVTKTPLAAALLVFAVVSVGLSLAGLELGRALGVQLEGRAEWLAGAVLTAVGALIAANVL
jgi:manganese efflux pump family protein